MSQSTSDTPTEELKNGAEELRAKVEEGLHAAEGAVKKGVDASKAKLNDAIDRTAEGVDQAHMYLKEQARERPIALTAAAIGAGVLLGLILANGRRR
jgi:ElaB/YqjD/DUF883 family membrane-anchored ribosome-binding protein